MRTHTDRQYYYAIGYIYNRGGGEYLSKTMPLWEIIFAIDVDAMIMISVIFVHLSMAMDLLEMVYKRNQAAHSVSV
jgi:hypothetical protein